MAKKTKSKPKLEAPETTETVVATRTYSKMNKRIKAKWLAALRSGEYNQGRHRLKHTFSGKDPFSCGKKLKKPTFCCLGVLCDLEKKGKWVETNPDAPEDVFFEFENEKSDETPPVTLLKKVGLCGEAIDELVTLNDDKRARFKKIADFIEKNL